MTNPYYVGRVNRNLLDNWYFGNPVNQRGQSSYSGGFKTYGIDRWYGTSATMTATVGDGCLTLTQTPGGGGQYRQEVENGTVKPGETLTISMLLKSDCKNPLQIVFFYYTTDWRYTGICRFNATGDVQLVESTFTVPSDATKMCGFGFTSLVGTADLYAAKMERGNVQTLAYQDADEKWQLYETPDYITELQKCMQYQYVIKPLKSFNPLNVTIARSGAVPLVAIDTQVPLRAVPTAVSTGELRLCQNCYYSSGNSYLASLGNVDSVTNKCVFVFVVLQDGSSALDANTPYLVTGGKDSMIIFDANL